MVTTSIQNAAMLVTALNKEGSLKLKDFCDKHKLSLHYMEQIGRKLRNFEILGARRGPGGGYFLARERVSVADLFMAISASKKELNTPLSRAVVKALDTIVIARRQLPDKNGRSVKTNEKINAQNEQNA